jgi:hypothetical protein
VTALPKILVPKTFLSRGDLVTITQLGVPDWLPGDLCIVTRISDGMNADSYSLVHNPRINLQWWFHNRDVSVVR